MNEILNTAIHIGHHSLTVLDLVELVLLVLGARLVLGILKRALRRAARFSALEQGKRFMVHRLVATGVWSLTLVSALSILGMDLTAVWAGSAALLVGVGIGLQGFFNDVVSGFVLLFEGGVSVGNVLEVDGQLVKVERIDLRSTRVVSIDGELMVLPNSKVSGETVVNLTQGDEAMRIHVSVGVAYGSDIQQVEQLLLASMSAVPEVLKSPKPVVYFEDFGDSSLDFVVVGWIQEPWVRRAVRSAVRANIDARFRECGIQIPFPQRDLHVRDLAIRQ